jgi:predicted MFS family arabinose efflux permease
VPRQASLHGIILTMAVACGMTVANLYYAQPLLALMASSFRVSQGRAAALVTATQLGYACGLAFLVPLGDMVEKRRLACRTLLILAVVLFVAAFSPWFTLFFVMSLGIGVTSVVVQILIPFAADLVPAQQRGKYVGRVVSGSLLGVLLARSLSSVTAAAWGWRSIYLFSAAAMLMLSGVLRHILPSRQPNASVGYGQLLRSVLRLAVEEPVLRRRAAVQSLLFATFTCFWTSITYELVGAHHLSQLQLALFALVGAGGAAMAVVVGTLGDRGFGQAGRGVSIALGALAMMLAEFGSGSVLLLACAAVLLDMAVQGHQVLSQRDVYALREDARARVNTVYMTLTFIGGSIGSFVSGWLYSLDGWGGVTAFGISLPVLASGIWLYGMIREASPPSQFVGPAHPDSAPDSSG